MIDGLFKPKASMDELSTLHNNVASTLSKNLDDPKILALAIKFLKDNDVVTDIIQSNDIIELTQEIKSIARQEKDNVLTDDLIDILEEEMY